MMEGSREDEARRLLYDAYAALKELNLQYGLDYAYPEVAMDTYRRLGDHLFPESE